MKIRNADMQNDNNGSDKSVERGGLDDIQITNKTSSDDVVLVSIIISQY